MYIMTYKKGKPTFIWKLKEAHGRNEPFDCRNYAQAALYISGVALKKQETETITTPPVRAKSGWRMRSRGVEI
ncbi:hypothetical protein FACS189490_13120 [Clostridia bacterium]|nr:hypothetical protein FACS189490_13120 [Clostridia bacterium]